MMSDGRRAPSVVIQTLVGRYTFTVNASRLPANDHEEAVITPENESAQGGDG